MFPTNQNFQKNKDEEDDEDIDINNNININGSSSGTVFQIPYDPNQQQDMLLDDLFMGQTLQHHPHNPNLVNNEVVLMSKEQQYNNYETLLSPACSKLSNINNNERKVIRRDNERQRRQHMAILHSSLRSHLPLQLIKVNLLLLLHIVLFLIMYQN